MAHLQAASHDFSDSLLAPPPMLSPHNADVMDQLLAAEKADWTLLRLVLCTSVATLVMGLAGSLVA